MTLALSVDPFFDTASNTISYLLVDNETASAAIIDPVLDFDSASGHLKTTTADRLLTEVKARDLQLLYVLETHVHADHLTAGHYLRAKTGAKLAIGSEIKQVQQVFGEIFEASDLAYDGTAFDLLLSEGDEISFGNHAIRIIHTPGHTPACITYVIDDIAFVGDTLFMPDYGTARCDFPGGDPATLYASIQKILSLPAETRLFTCHDYLPKGREDYAWESSVAEQKQSNIHVGEDIAAKDFIDMRTARDATLSAPKLILPALQVNIRAGTLPPKEESGAVFLRLPVNAFPAFENISDDLAAKVEDFQPDWHI